MDRRGALQRMLQVMPSVPRSNGGIACDGAAFHCAEVGTAATENCHAGHQPDRVAG